MAVSTNNFGFMIDGEIDGAYIRKVDPGKRSRESKEHSAGCSLIVEPQAVGKLNYEPIKFDVALGMGKRMLDWIQEYFRGNPSKRSGSFLIGNPSGGSMRAEWSIEFHQAMITEVTIPELNAETGDTPYLSVTIQPEYSQTLPGNGAAIEQVVGNEDIGVYDSSSYLLSIDGMSNTDAGLITKIESFTVSAEVKANKTCGPDVPQWEFLRFKPMPEIKVHYSDELHRYFLDWENSYLRDSENTRDAHRSMELELQARGSRKSLFEVRFYNVGIYSSPHAAFDASSADFMRNSVSLKFSDIRMGGFAGMGASTAGVSRSAAPPI